MAKNVLILSSSLRKGGNSDLLCDEFVKGVRESGHNAEKIFCVTAAVKLRSFQKLIRYIALNEGPRHNHVINRQRARQNDSPSGIHQMQIPDQNIIGYHSSSEKHGKGEKEG